MSDSTENLLDVRNLSTKLLISGKLQAVVQDMEFSIRPGEIVGLVGESGSGKSITARSIIGLLPSSAEITGTVLFDGQDRLRMSRRELRRFRSDQIAMIFQDPRSHIDPLWRVEDYVGEGLRRHKGFDKSQARERSSTLLESLGIQDVDRVLRSYPDQLSGGMLQRVMIAGALSCEPRLIIADEATTALDVTVQSDILAILDDLRRTRHLSLLFITHDLGLASVICDRIVVMYAGRPMLDQPARELFERPAHPYAAALVAARPRTDQAVHRLRTVEGRPISALESPPGCPFHPRCPFARDECSVGEVPFRQVLPATVAACLRFEDIQQELARTVDDDV